MKDREELTKQIEKWLSERNHFCIGSSKERKEIEELLANIDSNISQEEMKRIDGEFNKFEKIYPIKFKDKVKRFVSKLIKRQ